jgi:hypothetical protein
MWKEIFEHLAAFFSHLCRVIKEDHQHFFNIASLRNDNWRYLFNIITLSKVRFAKEWNKIRKFSLMPFASHLHKQAWRLMRTSSGFRGVVIMAVRIDEVRCIYDVVTINVQGCRASATCPSMLHLSMTLLALCREVLGFKYHFGEWAAWLRLFVGFIILSRQMFGHNYVPLWLPTPTSFAHFILLLCLTRSNVHVNCVTDSIVNQTRNRIQLLYFRSW